MQTVSTDTINFKDAEKGFEPFAQALRSAGFDWQLGKTEDLTGYFQVHGNEAQLYFRLPASQREDLTEHEVISDLWSGVSESLVVIRKPQPGKLIKVRSMQLDGSTLTFAVS